MGVNPLLVCFVSLIVMSHSAPSRVKYDQRQEGDLNVRADLENFVILVIPTTAGTSPSTLGLLDLLSKAIPMRGHNKRQKHVRKPIHATPSLLDDVEEQDDTQSFLESKTAPYHVDISKSRKNLAKLHPSLAKSQNGGREELLVSPNLSLIKSAEEDDDDVREGGEGRQGRMVRLSKGFVLSMPLEVEEDLIKIDTKRIEKSKETKETKESKVTKEKDTKEARKKVDSVKGKDKEPKLKLLLLGAEHDEECGPGYERDENGVCQFLTHV